MELQDRLFQGVFSRLFVYNILWEDSEVDEQFLEIDEDSTMLGISGAGCRIAGHLSQHPRRIDTVDINPHHLALAALKSAAAQSLRSYEDFYDLLGRGAHHGHEALVRAIVAPLPRWIQRHWKERHHLFARAFYQQGLTAQMFAGLRLLAGINSAWTRRLCEMTVEERLAAIDATLTPVMRHPLLMRVLESPLQLLAIGVNFAQRDRMLRSHGLRLVDFLIDHVKRVAATDLDRNWFAWMAIAGHYNHTRHDAVPPYLRRDRHEASLRAPTRIEYHHRNLFEVLAAAGPRTWSHYTLCDMPDWLPAQGQARLLSEILRTSRAGGIVMYRSVEPDSMVARHHLQRHFEPLSARTSLASQLDRSRQYRSVNYYRIVH
jgi:S-adenosylmethionine-diacylglycerol 3-amino-3-carboxypropyl transferase